MSLRLFKSSRCYPQIAAEFDAEDGARETLNFEKSNQEFLNQGFVWGDSWKHYLEATGRFQVFEATINVKSLQEKWALENGIKFRLDKWELDILAAQIKAHQPNVWFSHGLVPGSFRVYIRELVPSIQLVIGYDGFLGHDPLQFSGCDLILTCVEETAAFYERAGFRALFWPHSFDSRWLIRLAESTDAPVSQCSFSGSLLLSNSVHVNRARFLDCLNGEFPMYMALGISPENWKGYMLALASHLRAGNYDAFIKMVESLPVWRRLRRTSFPAVHGLKMLSLLNSSDLTLNLHGDSVKVAANMRLFEATGVGTCLVTDWLPNLQRFFDVDREIVSFKSIGEGLEKIKWLLDFPKKREAIAQAGQRRCLRDHSFSERIKEIDSLIMSETF